MIELALHDFAFILFQSHLNERPPSQYVTIISIEIMHCVKKVIHAVLHLQGALRLLSFCLCKYGKSNGGGTVLSIAYTLVLQQMLGQE